MSIGFAQAAETTAWKLWIASLFPFVPFSQIWKCETLALRFPKVVSFCSSSVLVFFSSFFFSFLCVCVWWVFFS